MIKNGKYFVPPPRDGSDFKELFVQMASCGAGRSVGSDGLPIGPWSSESLASAMMDISKDPKGLELRTVQHWFEDNERGISAANIYLLARVFGCGDPESISLWQVELSSAQRRLVAKRRSRKARSDEPASSETQSLSYKGQDIENGLKPPDHFRLAKTTEAMFDNRSVVGLPVIVFSGATALGLISFSLGLHSIMFAPTSTTLKQVGFLWAPNWTVVFIVIVPLYLAMVGTLLDDWKSRLHILSFGQTSILEGWERNLVAATPMFWSVLALTLLVASGLNWTMTHLVPLINGDPGDWPVDWGRVALFQPEAVSIQSAIIFSGLVFMFNGVVAYMFFAGLVLLYLLLAHLRYAQKLVTAVIRRQLEVA